MHEELRVFLQELDGAAKFLRKSRAPQINTQQGRSLIAGLVDHYFRAMRPCIPSVLASSEAVASVDASFQDLLVRSHGRASKSAVCDDLRSIRKTLVAVEAQALLLIAAPASVMRIEPLDDRILGVLEKIVPSAAASYKQALLDVQGPEKTSWRGPATDLREALRETLDFLAPDQDVSSESGFKLEGDAKRPTMKQKVRHILKKRRISSTASETSARAVDSIELAVGSFVRSVYDRSSLSTHTATTRAEVLRIRDLVRVVFCELLEVH